MKKHREAPSGYPLILAFQNKLLMNGVGFFRNAVAYIFLLMIGNFQHSIPFLLSRVLEAAAKLISRKKPQLKAHL